MSYTHRYIARITVEAETPIAVGSGEKGLNTDRLVAKDANGLPYIPGTGLTGVLRHSFEKGSWVDDIFGSGGDKGKGSRLIVSSAFLLGEDGKTVMDGLREVDLNSGFYSFFSRLPERDHVRITYKGVADSENHGKFDEELVHKGTRFVFELELIGDENDNDNWKKLLQAIASPAYRIGAGTRKGFGKLKIISSLSASLELNLKEETDLKLYLQKSSSLNEDISEWKALNIENNQEMKGWKDYSFKMKSKDFFSFSAGFGDDEADNKPKTEKYFDWSSGKPVLTKQEFTLIPATSIKGALSHRVAYHYNVLTGNTIGNNTVRLDSELDLQKVENSMTNKFDIKNIDLPSDSEQWSKIEESINQLQIEDISEWDDFQNQIKTEVREKKDNQLPFGENNEAVKALFGFAKNSDKENEKEGLRGSVLIEDIYLSNAKTKVFNHTSIDRFTNGTIDGALFQEKVSHYSNEIEIKIWVEETAFTDSKIKEAFEQSLEDLKSGMLTLGGSTTKGHGVFEGIKN